jgi:6-phosphofructokinase 1
MIGARKGNTLIMQSGGCTPVFNRSLFGVVHEASANGVFGAIYGAAHGLEGLLSSRVTRVRKSELNGLIDLGRQSKATWARIVRTPGAALGSTRRKLSPQDVPALLEVLAKHDIRYWFIIGGNDAAATGHSISLGSKAAGYPLTVINVPKTIDNDLVSTDHSPGYGSAARFVALATMGAGRDAEAMGQASPITVIEVMGRDAGWLAASAALARREEGDAPHLICVPEVPVDESRFLEYTEEAYRRFGFAVAVIAENTRGQTGVLGGETEPWYTDDFGHPYFEGPGRYLAGLVSRRLKVRARYEKPGTIQRSMMACVSGADAQEAEMAGRAAVRFALEGHSDQMVTLVRGAGERYACTTGLAPLARVAGQARTMPGRYLDPSGYFVTSEFISYAGPLIGTPLPRFGRLS